MQLDVVNANNEKVGALTLRDEVFGGKVKTDLIWEAVVHANAAARRGTHMTKNRALVSGSGKKPWRQKGTGRARVGEIRNPLWRKGGTVFGPQPRSYDYPLPRRVERGALRAAIMQKLNDGAVVVVDALALDEIRTKVAAELLAQLGVTGKAVLVDVSVDDNLARSVRNIPGVELVPTMRLTARQVADAERVVATKSALERLQDALAATPGGAGNGPVPPSPGEPVAEASVAPAEKRKRAPAAKPTRKTQSATRRASPRRSRS